LDEQSCHLAGRSFIGLAGPVITSAMKTDVNHRYPSIMQHLIPHGNMAPAQAARPVFSTADFNALIKRFSSKNQARLKALGE
jgi:hypothetical protein